jgi:4-diphosphocytidyl-2-C-methyl-D-erythritol kinase
VAKPKISVSTPTILKQINYESVQHIQIDQLVTAINSGDAENIFASMGNVLEPITAAKHPEIDHLKGKMMKIGSDAAQMTGTGPTMFAVCEKLSRAKRLTNSLKGFCSEVYLVRSL